jgi:2-deoxy-D-gluconate 3-dehydrogenase
MKLFDLNGRVAVITGGNAGIGLGIAKGLAAAAQRLSLLAVELRRILKLPGR